MPEWLAGIWSLLDRQVSQLTTLRASLTFSLQTWLAETPEQTRKASTPGYLSVGMARKFSFKVISEISTHSS